MTAPDPWPAVAARLGEFADDLDEYPDKLCGPHRGSPLCQDHAADIRGALSLIAEMRADHAENFAGKVVMTLEAFEAQSARIAELERQAREDAEANALIREAASLLKGSTPNQRVAELTREVEALTQRAEAAERRIEALENALAEGERCLTQALGIIVEFGDLNGFRNLSDQELGAAVIGMATSGAATLDRLRNALSPASPEEGDHAE